MPADERVRILSIDGGGIRGIIPALVLAEIERLSARPACELFDLIAGTSTGGIIALGVTVPDPGGSKHPRWSAQELALLYEEEGPKIFHRSLLRTIETVDGLLVEKYAASGLEAALERYMGDARLPQALTDVLITSYDIQQHEPFLFKSFSPRPHTTTVPSAGAGRSAVAPVQPADYPMKLVARATSAAPTYFEPEDLHALPPSAAGSPTDFVLVDGGTFANNPAMCAYAEVARNRPGADLVIVSLGTGRLTESISYRRAKHWGLAQWAHPLLDVIMDGTSAAIDYQLGELLGADLGHFRFQTVLEGVSDSLDDASPANIEGLRELAQRFIASNAERLERVCALLTASGAGSG
jgi:uncharacterized protein